jgi:membrane protease YdiL (CAAX protease family)
MGEIAAPAKAVPWLGLGISLSFIVTLAVLAFVFVRFRRTIESLGQVIPFVPWVVLFSITNSLSEEVIYRLGVVVPLLGVVDTGTVLLVSAAAFGLAHLRGMPNGMLGMLMAGFLGWLLAKSVVETKEFSGPGVSTSCRIW